MRSKQAKNGVMFYHLISIDYTIFLGSHAIKDPRGSG